MRHAASLAALGWTVCVAMTQAVTCPKERKTQSVSVQLTSDVGDPNFTNQSEVSGVVFSEQLVNQEPIVWVVSDSGSKPQLAAYGIKTKKRLAGVDFAKSLVSGGNRDYEDLAIGPCSTPGGKKCIFVGAIGDNAARDAKGQSSSFLVKHIYRFEEPDLPSTVNVNSPPKFDIANAEAIKYSLDQSGIVAADCETIMADPVTGDLFFVTKWNSPERGLTSVFRIPAGASGTQTLTIKPLSSKNSVLTSKTWTRGDISRDGSMIALGSTAEAFFWVRQPGQSIEQALNAEPCFSIPKPPSGNQHEALSFGRTATELFEISEGNDPDLWISEFAPEAGGDAGGDQGGDQGAGGETGGGGDAGNGSGGDPNTPGGGSSGSPPPTPDEGGDSKTALIVVVSALVLVPAAAAIVTKLTGRKETRQSQLAAY